MSTHEVNEVRARHRVKTFVNSDVSVEATVLEYPHQRDEIPEEAILEWHNGYKAAHGQECLVDTPYDLPLRKWWRFDDAYSSGVIYAGEIDDGAAWLEPVNGDEDDAHEWVWYDQDGNRYRLGLLMWGDNVEPVVRILRGSGS